MSRALRGWPDSVLIAAHTGLTPERALEQLHRIQHHRVRLGGAEPVTDVSTINARQSEVLGSRPRSRGGSVASGPRIGP
jgi:hypothetical protein